MDFVKEVTGISVGTDKVFTPKRKPAKKAAKRKPTKKAAKRKPIAKKAAKRKPIAKKKRPAKSKTKKVAKPGRIVHRPERLDMRLTKAEKARVVAKAKKTKRTVTSLMIEAVGKVR